eukprot:Opistho-2@44335
MTKDEDMSSLLSNLMHLEGNVLQSNAVTGASGRKEPGTQRRATVSYVPKTASNLNAVQKKDFHRAMDDADKAHRMAADSTASTMRSLKQRLEQLETTKDTPAPVGKNTRQRLSVSVSGPSSSGAPVTMKAGTATSTPAMSATDTKTPRTLTKSQFTIVPRTASTTSETAPTFNVAELSEELDAMANAGSRSHSPAGALSPLRTRSPLGGASTATQPTTQSVAQTTTTQATLSAERGSSGRKRSLSDASASSAAAIASSTGGAQPSQSTPHSTLRKTVSNTSAGLLPPI